MVRASVGNVLHSVWCAAEAESRNGDVLVDQGTAHGRSIIHEDRSVPAFSSARSVLPDCVCAGSWYEAFDVDAEIVHRELGFQFKSSGKHKQVGAPEPRIADVEDALVGRGFRVGIVEQLSSEIDPGPGGRTLVPRALRSISTPGTAGGPGELAVVYVNALIVHSHVHMYDVCSRAQVRVGCCSRRGCLQCLDACCEGHC